MINLILFGPPGSGKGTQSERLRDRFDLMHISTGEILRSEMAKGTELGKEAAKLINKGNLVPDEVVIKMIAEAIDHYGDSAGFVFDGFPRTPEQAKALDVLLAERNMSLTAVLALDVSREELIQRLSSRAAKDDRADDKDGQIIENRIQVYRTHTQPLKEYYQQQDKFVCIDGEGHVDEIFGRLVAEVNKHKG